MRVLVLASVLAASAAHRAWKPPTRYSHYNRSPYFGAAAGAWQSPAGYSEYNPAPYFGGAGGAWQSPAGYSEYNLAPYFGNAGTWQPYKENFEFDRSPLFEREFDPFAAEFPSCRGSRQSPINLDPSSSPAREFEPFFFLRYQQIPDAESITNTGHSVEVKLISRNLPEVSGGNLGATYKFDQYHLHWGAEDSRGSEHTIDNFRFPMELHLVHHNTKYASFNASLEHRDGVAVLGVLFVISELDNPLLQPLIDHLMSITEAGQEDIAVDLYPLASLLPRDLSRFYRYHGSLTTPMCNEVVTWTIFDDYVPVSDAQMARLRSLMDTEGDPLLNNFRPNQLLNGRTVYRSFLY
ncbi:carbonic anhydrase-like isoform X2 [Hyalella azteca]|uniref:Carbonic anhydrase n=1 Tax=Hyalella azteca TaxID=294128 RepID=A0A8B7NTQ3_HYAAZ|nr:carbonic anhydrase-like isoform X2 [Hyalella azteca]